MNYSEDKSTSFSQHPMLRCGDRIIDLSTPIVMGILNLTPDSFYDGATISDFGVRWHPLWHVHHKKNRHARRHPNRIKLQGYLHLIAMIHIIASLFYTMICIIVVRFDWAII